jgi:arylformamidase
MIPQFAAEACLNDPIVFVEVSHPVVPGMKTYPGLPEPQAEVLLDYDASRAKYGGLAEFQIASLKLCGNTGTYVDAPRHRYRDGPDLASLSLASLAHRPVVVVDARHSAIRGIGPDFLPRRPLQGCAVLFHTGWSARWGTPAYFDQNPFLTAACCDALVEGGAALVGIDSLNIDDVGDLSRPAHTKLLGAGIPVCEHLTNLERLPPRGGFLHAVPIAWAGGTTFPVRAYVMIPAEVSG